jgi:rod shape determining protein RodA
MRFAVPAYLLGVRCLVAVALAGDVVNGARRWLHVGVTRFQPSEMMKLALPLMLAWYFHKNEATLRMRDFAVAAVLLAVPVLLIARQPTWAPRCWWPPRLLRDLLCRHRLEGDCGAGGGGPGELFPLWGMLHDYQRRRILTLFDPTQDPLGAGYHTIQSTIAVGSGGITGKGWLHGTQTHLEFIPSGTPISSSRCSPRSSAHRQRRSAHAIHAADRARLMIAANAATFFSRLLAASITLMFFTYAFVNMGMVLGDPPWSACPCPSSPMAAPRC